MSKADEYLLEIGLDSDLLPEFFNNDDKSYYSVPELMESFAQERIKQEREKWDKELEELKESEKNGRDWFEAYMYLESFVSGEINKLGIDYPIVSEKHPQKNTIEAIKLLQQPSKTKH